MMEEKFFRDNLIDSFTGHCLARGDEVYLAEPSPLMYCFFGTTEADYREGILRRIRVDTFGEEFGEPETLPEKK